MSSENSDSMQSIVLSLVAQFDDINRLNGVLNSEYSEQRFLEFLKQMECVMTRWSAAEAETVRLQAELEEALKSLTKWESKFVHVRKLLDSEKRERNIVLTKYNELVKLLDLARDLLFNDNRTKLNDETLQKLAFLNGTAQQDLNAKLPHATELNTTGALLSEMSYSRSEDDLDISLLSTRRSWVQRGGWNARDNAPTSKRRRSSTNSSATKTVELQGGKVLATATTTLTLQRQPTNQDLKPPQNFTPISESSDEAPPPKKSPGHCLGGQRQVREEYTPSAPPRSGTETDSGTEGLRSCPQRTPSVVSAVLGGSPRTRPREHIFHAKNFYKRETCGPCGKPIKFAKLALRCETCRATTHPECRSALPLPCVPPPAAAPSPRSKLQTGSIADYAPGTPPMVPALLVHCINEVEKRGLNERGIYRINAVEKDVKKLKERFLRGCGSPQLSTEDIHVVCGCIKDFLRSLKEPLVSAALWRDFMDAAGQRENGEAAIVQAVSQLPMPNRDTLAFLVLHLQKVAESPECEMGIDNLAKIFGPNVVGFGMATSAAEMYTATTQMNKVMQLLLMLPGDYWSTWACPNASPTRVTHKPKAFIFSPANGAPRMKKKNYLLI